ncbi:MAG TPA: hypothetical protein DD417_01145 [Elusimicrobia bacterium]|nr:hypothetical protein [Elusimicrobiota bacterium]
MPLLSKIARYAVPLGAAASCFLAGCVSIPSGEAFRYDPQGRRAGAKALPYSVIVAPFEDERVKKSMGFLSILAGGDFYTAPRTYAKWLSEELASAKVFDSVRFVSWKKLAEGTAAGDILITGTLKDYPPKQKGPMSIEIQARDFAAPSQVLWAKEYTAERDTKVMDYYIASGAGLQKVNRAAVEDLLKSLPAAKKSPEE